MPHEVKPLSSATHQHQHTHTHKCTNGLLTLVPLELPTFSSKLHCSFAACTEMEEGGEIDKHKNDNNDKKETNRKGKETKRKIHD